VIIDGTLIPIDRVAADRPFYSGCDDRCVLPRAVACASPRSVET
jgi:hypothetical protein